MDKHEARLMLQSYRPGGRDADDPAFAEALALARQDPELGAWFRRECELDAAISVRLQQAPVPADLRQAILAGHRSQRRAGRQSPSPAWWRSPAAAWAAAVTLLLAAGFYFRNDSRARTGAPVSIAAYRTAMAANLNAGFVFDVHSSEPEQLGAWLTRNGIFKNLELPEHLRNSTSIGCKVFDYENLKPVLICFTLPDKQVVHLFVVEARAFDGGWVGPDRSLCRSDRWNACYWRNDEQVFLLMGGPEVDGGRLASIAGVGK